MKFVVILIAILTVSNCENLNLNLNATLASGDRIDGDRLIGIQHKMSSFFTVPSPFEFTFDFKADNVNITYYVVSIHGVSYNH